MYIRNALRSTSLMRTIFWVPSCKLRSSIGHRYASTKGSLSEEPIKFTTSQANIDYKALYNFAHDPREFPPGHNYILAGSMISGIFYLIFLRDDVDEDGGLFLFEPIHDQVPGMAIPLLQSAIAENKKYGRDTKKLEIKLAKLQGGRQ